MRSNLKRFARVLTAVTALAVVAAAVPYASPAQALPPGSPSSGTLTISPTTGDSGTPFSLNFTSNPQVCPGDANGGYRWQTFIASAAVDPGTLTYSGLGSPTAGLPVVPGAYFASLRTPGGTQIRAQLPSLVSGQIDFSAISSIGFQATAAPPGDYNIGVACTLGAETVKFWSLPVTVVASPGAGPQNYIIGIPAPPAAPVAPVLASPLTTGNGTLAGSFTATASTPPTTGFTVTADPAGPGANITLPVATAGSFTLTGLTNGVAYDVSVTATNSIGTSPASNVVSGTPGVAAQPAIPLSLTPGTGQITASFTAPTGVVPTGYTLTVSPAPGGTTPATFAIAPAVGVISQVVGDLTPGTPYTFTLTPAYAAPDSGTPTVATATPTSAQVIQQRIEVTRPVGALILTQRCGVYGALDAFTAVDAFPGYPLALAAETATTDQIGTTPDITPAPAGQPADSVTPDPEFGDYPFPSPATYPTECGIDLGEADLVTEGALTGQYYAADGRLNEVTVVDTRDADAGWTVTGTMDDFIGTVAPANTFSGDYLGWAPQVQNSTPGQVVTAGADVLSGTTDGLGDGATLASATAGSGLGVAQLDARITLLIPVSQATDDYVGILGFTVA